MQQQQQLHGQTMQMNDERLKSEQFANQDHQLKQRDDQLNSTAFGQAQGDPDKHVALFAQSGARPQAVQDLQKHYLGIQKDTAEIADKQLKVRQDQNERFTGLVQQARALSPADYAAAYPQIKAAALAIHPEMKAQLPDEPVPQDVLGHMEMGLVTDKTFLDREAAKRAATAASEATAAAGRAAEMQPYKIAEEQTKRDQTAREAAARANPSDPALQQAALTAKERADAARMAREEAERNRHNKVDEGQGAARLAQGARANDLHAAEADPYGLLGVNKHPVSAGGAGKSGDDFLATLPPTLAAKVKAVSDGRQPIPNARGGVLRGEGKAISDAVYQYDPEFSTQRADLRKAFTTGKVADNIGALNTAVGHLDQLSEAAKAMKNGSFRPGNQLYNTVSTMFGGSAPTTLAAITAAAAGEAATALKGNATDPEIKHITDTLKSSSSPEQFDGVVKEMLGVYGKKLGTYAERHAQAIPGDKTYSPILPSAKAVFDKHGVNSTGGAAALPNGGGKVIDEATGKRFYDAAGGDPAKARKLATDAGWKVQ